MARFAHRFVVVTETQHVVKKNSFGFRSCADRRDALALRDAINGKRSVWKRAYIVDQQNPGNCILPEAKGGR